MSGTFMTFDQVAPIVEERNRLRKEIEALKAQVEMLSTPHTDAMEKQRITNNVARRALKLFDAEFIGQDPRKLWDWAIDAAMGDTDGT